MISEETKKWAMQLFWRRGDHLRERASAADKSKPIQTNSSGYVDPTFYDLSAFTGAAKFTDNVFTLADNSDPTKLAQFQLSGITAGNTRTYTMPNATGTLALLGLAQTWNALQTFSSGIAFGNETLSAYDEGTWSPEIAGSTGDPTIAYTLQVGQYTRIGRVYLFSLDVRIDTISGGSGDIEISLPATVIAGTGFNFMCQCAVQGVNLTNTPAAVSFQCVQNEAYGYIRTTRDDTTIVTEQIGTLAAGDIIQATGHFFV